MLAIASYGLRTTPGDCKEVLAIALRATDRSCFALRRTTADVGVTCLHIPLNSEGGNSKSGVGRWGGLPSARRPLADLETSILLSHRQFPNRRSAKTARNPLRFPLKIAVGPTSSPFSEVFHTVKWRFFLICPTNHLQRRRPFYD